MPRPLAINSFMAFGPYSEGLTVSVKFLIDDFRDCWYNENFDATISSWTCRTFRRKVKLR